MLKSLLIKNIALIEELHIDLSENLNIFSGETGAGKSIIIDSLNFLLNKKADKSLIRHGEEKAYVEGVFDITNREDIYLALENIGVEQEETLIITKSMNINGKTDIRINGKQVTLSMLREISHFLVDVHGQSEHFMLADVATHLELLDKFGGKEIATVFSEYSKTYQEYLSIKEQLASFGGSFEERQRLIDLYTYQIDEIENANLQENEINELEDRFKLISNVEKIATNISAVLSSLSSEEGALYAFSEAKRSLNTIENLSQIFPPLLERIRTIEIECDDIFSTISDYSESLNFDPREADKIADRLEFIKNLKRKYGSSIEEIYAYLDKTTAERDRLVHSTEEIERLNCELENILVKIKNIGLKLSKLRKDYAEKFEKNILTELCDLGMKNSKFTVAINFNEDEFNKNGFDEVEYMFSANVGEPLKPLIKVISGGEMSRFMLALKSITQELDNIPTMIFDEIDTGISGHIAHVVAEKFVKLSRKSQIIVITHLPQIASTGDTNFFIEKMEKDGRTVSTIVPLSYDQTIKEIARLSGSFVYDETSLTHAKLLKESFDLKKV